MEKTIEGFRRSQAKLTELERTNKKLQVSQHSSLPYPALAIQCSVLSLPSVLHVLGVDCAIGIVS